MATSRTASRAANSACKEVLSDLKDDHKRVKKAYRDFQKIDTEENPEACAEIVRQVLDELTVHAAIEEELLYPAARRVIADENLIDEAEVEHETLHTLIDQLRELGPQDEKFAARFIVLCEYVVHHVKEEEGEMFPQLEHARLDWPSLASEINERRQELMPEQVGERSDDEQDDPEAQAQAGRPPAPMGGTRRGAGDASDRERSGGRSSRRG